MKKQLLLILLGTLSLLGYSQNYSKQIPISKKTKDYTFLQGVYALPNKSILLVFNYKESIKINIYDDEFNELDSREIPDMKNSWSCKYEVHNNTLYIASEEKKQDGFSLFKVDLNNKINIKKYSIPNGNAFSISISESDEICYYKTDEYMSSFNFDTKKETKLKIKVEKREKVNIHGVTIFPSNNIVATDRLREKAIGLPVNEFALHDSLGQEIFVYNQLDKDKHFVTNSFVAIDNDIYIGGSYSKKEVTKIGLSKPTFNGIYLKKINSKDNFEKLHEFSDFKSLTSIANSKEKEKEKEEHKHFGFSLEDIINLGKEKVVIGKFYQYKYGLESDDRRNEVSYGLTGIKLKYILVFGINNLGQVLWDDVIEIKDLDKEVSLSGSLYEKITSGKLMNIERSNDIIKCHFYYNTHIINYFEINSDNKVINKKEFDYGEGIHSIVLKSTNYWYGDYYFYRNYKSEPFESIMFNKIKFK